MGQDSDPVLHTDRLGILSHEVIIRLPDNDAADTREEFCIGNGAHTRYWDDTAPAIAARLDRLLAEA